MWPDCRFMDPETEHTPYICFTVSSNSSVKVIRMHLVDNTTLFKQLFAGGSVVGTVTPHNKSVPGWVLGLCMLSA